MSSSVLDILSFEKTKKHPSRNSSMLAHIAIWNPANVSDDQTASCTSCATLGKRLISHQFVPFVTQMEKRGFCRCWREQSTPLWCICYIVASTHRL